MRQEKLDVIWRCLLYFTTSVDDGRGRETPSKKQKDDKEVGKERE